MTKNVGSAKCDAVNDRQSFLQKSAGPQHAKLALRTGVVPFSFGEMNNHRQLVVLEGVIYSYDVISADL